MKGEQEVRVPRTMPCFVLFLTSYIYRAVRSLRLMTAHPKTSSLRAEKRKRHGGAGHPPQGVQSEKGKEQSGHRMKGKERGEEEKKKKKCLPTGPRS